MALPDVFLDAARRGKWLPIAAAAKLAGVSTQTFRNRLRAINAREGGGILRKSGPGRFARLEVNVEALQHVMQTDSSLRDATIDALREQVAAHDRRLNALREAYFDLRVKLNCT